MKYVRTFQLDQSLFRFTKTACNAAEHELTIVEVVVGLNSLTMAPLSCSSHDEGSEVVN